MPYQSLYRRRQEANGDFRIRQWYVDAALELPWVREIDIYASDELPVSDLRGFIVRHGLEAQNCIDHRYTIVLAEGMDPFMERFVTIKELMHCYFEAGDGTATYNEIVLDAHLRQFFGQSASSQSAHVQAEYTAFWMAMGVLCPERQRADYRRKCEADELTIAEVSQMLQAPDHIIRRFLSDQYEDEIRDIIN